MQTRFSISHCAAVWLATGIALGSHASAFAQERKTPARVVWDGVYTAAQADRGKAGYLNECSACHKDDLSGYEGVLKTDRIMEHWQDDSLDSLFQTMKSTMPRSAPGSLSEKLYLDILAYILQANGFPAGAGELTIDALPGIQVEQKSGPAGVQTGALVEVVGCLVENPAKTWSLTSAREAVRTRNPNDATPEELKAWKALPLGTHLFGLINATSYRAESKKGFKVEAKGLLIRNPGDDRINLTALEASDVKCQANP